MFLKRKWWLLSLLLIFSVTKGVFASQESIDEALLTAVEQKKFSKVKKLLDKGANIETRGMLEQTPLIIASSEKSKDIVKLLIDRGCDVNAVDGFGTTALHAGVRNFEITKMLLAAGSDPWKEDKNGLTPLDHAASGYTDRIEVLSLFLDFKPDRALLNKALVSAVAGGNPKKVVFFIKKAAEIDAPEGRESPLIVAADNGSWRAARLLLRRGVRIDQRDKRGWTALYHAVSRGDEGMVRLLLRYGANLQIIPKGEKAPLALSLANEKYEISRLLVAAGADINDDYYGEPIIDVVKSRGPEDLAKLMEKGASEKLKKELWVDAPIDDAREIELKKLLVGKWQMKGPEAVILFSNQGNFTWSIEGIFSKQILEGTWYLKDGDLCLDVKKSSEGEKPFMRQLALVYLSDKDLIFDGLFERIRYERMN